MLDIRNLSGEEINLIEEERKKKLGTFFNETIVDNIIFKELRYNYGYLHLNPFLMGKFGNKFELSINDNEKNIHLGYIGVLPNEQKKGIGSQMMFELTALADKYQYTIDLRVDAKFGVKKSVLLEFYKKFEFIQQGKSNDYIRYPKLQNEVLVLSKNSKKVYYDMQTKEVEKE